MNDSNSLIEAMSLVGQIRAERGWRAWLATRYWGGAFRLTRMVEALAENKSSAANGHRVLNFGCGNRFLANAVNSDLFAPHRFLKGKRKPELYWTGLRDLKNFHGYFEGVVCEHVIEHIHPDVVLEIFRNMRSVMGKDSVIVVSFPDVQRVLSTGHCQGFSSAIVAANSLIYRFSHCFMYDTELVKQLLLCAGFESVGEESFQNLPLQWALGTGRVNESSYVVARRSE